MKYRHLVILTAFLTVSILAFSSILPSTEPASAQTKQTPTITKQKTVRPSPCVKAVIKGSENPNQIPDKVAYELFLRTVAEGNARALVRRAGFADEDIERIMSDANILNDRLTNLDRQARAIKEKSKDSSNLQTNTELAKLETKRNEYVAEATDHYLSRSLNSAGIGKLQGFIKTSVKSNTQKILIKGDSPINEFAFNKSFVKSFAPKQNSYSGQLYLYSTAWDDGTNVYGSGSLSEQYASSTSYRVTTTVTSPSGRSNATFSDWSYAPVSNDAGLSIGVEDGTYTVQADFEEQSGYYDEYGSFYGDGSSFVGSSISSDAPIPTIKITQIQPPAQTLYVPNPNQNTSNLPTSQEFNVTVSPSSEVKNPTNIIVEFVEDMVSPTNPRPKATRSAITKSVAITDAGSAVFVPFTVTVDSDSPAGTIVYRANLVSAEAPAGQPTPMISGSATATVTIALAPTPTPTPTPNATPTPGGGNDGEIAHCYRRGFDWNFEFGYCDTSNCYFPDGCSPIVIDTQGDGFALTNAANGVRFDLGATGTPAQISWTAANGDDAWLALDRNHNNRIDDGKELFGTATDQPDGTNPRNGFAALAVFDTPAQGGNGDNQITRSDAIFQKLRLWIDRNHNGISEPEELYRLPALDVVAISLDYKESKRTDEFGNRFRFRSKVRDSRNVKVGRWAWDVFLNVAP